MDPSASDEDVNLLLADAAKAFNAARRSLPAEGPLVLSELHAWARRSVVGAYYMTRALQVGLVSDEGRALADISAKHDLAASRHATAARTHANLEANSARPVECEVITVNEQTTAVFAEAMVKAKAEFEGK